MSHPLEPMQFVGRLLIGAALGVLIGLERQRKRSAVGVHTTALVSVGATLFAALEPLLGDTSTVRVVANIVTGVGFLAGGVILKEGPNIRGLNTAATLWSTAAVGALAGVGLLWESAAAALVIVGVNVVMDPIADRNQPARSSEQRCRNRVRLDGGFFRASGTGGAPVDHRRGEPLKALVTRVTWKRSE